MIGLTKAERKAAALAAASSAIEAAQELIRYAREGAHYRMPPFGDVDVPELLADAARAALEIESDEQRDGPPRDDADERNWFVGAIGRFLDGWAR